jgi:hypothetical protein
MRELTVTEIECIVNRVLRTNDVYVMSFFGSKLFPAPLQMFINHGVNNAR